MKRLVWSVSDASTIDRESQEQAKIKVAMKKLKNIPNVCYKINPWRQFVGRFKMIPYLLIRLIVETRG